MIPMRCAVCGTDNAPDSRFCGGCGGRLGTTIPPTSQPLPSGPPSGVRVAPPGRPTDVLQGPVVIDSVPPSMHGPMTTPPPPSRVSGPSSIPPPSAVLGSRPPAPLATPRPPPPSNGVPDGIRARANEDAGGPSLVSPARRKTPWLLLAIDLVMVIGGILFLRAGIAMSDDDGDDGADGAKQEPAPTAPAPTPPGGDGSASALPPAIVPPALGAGSGSAMLGATASTGVGGGGLLAPKRPSAGSNTASGRGSGAGATTTVTPDAAVFAQPPADAKPPADPPADPPKPLSRSDEIDRQASKSQSKFDRCKAQVADTRPADRPLHGDVEIAFQITATGEVRNAAVVRDTTTEAPDLGPCLLAVIQSWHFSASDDPTGDFMRSFRYR